jgi:hypothetical protein
MPNGYTAGVIDGDYDAAMYLARAARGFGFAMAQRDSDPDEPVKRRTVSEYTINSVKNAEFELVEFENKSESELFSDYQEYCRKTHARNMDSIERAAKNLERINAVRAVLRQLTVDPLLGNFMETSMKWLDETESWDCKPYVSEIMPFEEWLDNLKEGLERTLKRSKESYEEELVRVADQHKYVDLLEELIAQAKALDTAPAF